MSLLAILAAYVVLAGLLCVSLALVDPGPEPAGRVTPEAGRWTR